ncbi:MAG: DEAD/DEAH box helicase [Bacteroidales bacterium]|jgi:hypothetical protein|nr:DEAD/DEAH box helicase [Bacteroidales bacterium]
MGNTDDKDIIVDGVRLDPDNAEFFNAARIITDTDKQVVFLTGKAGTGKTTFLKYIRQIFNGNAVVLTPTGVAAVNAGGQTIFSFFKLDYNTPFLPEDKRLKSPEIFNYLKYNERKLEIIRNLSLLIIDEVSMVRCDRLDAINLILKAYRSRHDLPFGGVKVLLIGDVFQLPPIVNKTGIIKGFDDEISEFDFLKEFYDTQYFFSSRVYKECNPIHIELVKPYRQSESAFISLLDKIRVKDVSIKDLEILNERVIKNSREELQIEKKEHPIMLAPLNSLVNKYNEEQFEKLDSETCTFVGKVTDDFPKKMMVAELEICLRPGAQVMILKNSYNPVLGEFEYYNGTIGIVKRIDKKSKTVTVSLSKESHLPNNEVSIKPAVWENIEFIWDKEEQSIRTVVKGTFSQIPLKLAWSISIHKSQGLTFDSVIADLPDCFDFGHVYVALSRCRTLNGLHLRYPINENCIKVDSHVVNFAKQKTPNTLITREIDFTKADELYKKSIACFEENLAEDMLSNIDKAVAIRDDRKKPAFTKFIATKLHLFHRYKGFYKSLYIKLLSVQNQKNEVEEKLNDTNIELKNHRASIISMRTRYYSLLKNLQDSEENVNQLSAQVNSKEEEIVRLKKLLSLRELEIRENKKEIYRLNSLTWWQKLFGE